MLIINNLNKLKTWVSNGSEQASSIYKFLNNPLDPKINMKKSGTSPPISDALTRSSSLHFFEN